MDDKTASKIMNISRNHAAEVLEVSCEYLQKILNVNVKTGATVIELAAAMQASINYLRDHAAKMAAA